MRAVRRLAAALPSSAAADPPRDARRQRAAIGLERLRAASRVLLQIPNMQSKIDDVASSGCKRETPRREPDRLIDPEEARLPLGRLQIGPRRLGLSRAVEMLGAQHGIVNEHRGCRLVQFPPSRMGERTVDPIAHQGMGELEAVRDRPQEDASQQRVTGIVRLLKQRSEMGQAEALAEDGCSLDRAAVLGRQEVGAGEHDVLNRTRQSTVGEVRGAPEQLLQEQRIAAGSLDALTDESIGADKTSRDRARSAGRQGRKVDGDECRSAGDRAPMGVQRIAFETGCHRQDAAA